MLTNVVISIITSVVSFFDGLLPHVSVPSWFVTDAGSGVMTNIGDLLAGAKNSLPVVAILNVLHDLLVFLPIVLGYMLFDWVWTHSPTILGNRL